MTKIPSPKYAGWSNYFIGIFPGLLFCFVIGVIAVLLDDHLVPEELFIVNYVLIALGLGLIMGNILPQLGKLEAGIEFAAKICLFIGIVLLGAKLNLVEIFQIGGNSIIIVAGSIALSIILCGWIGKKIFDNERWGHLVGTGIGVCGVSAVMALAPAIKAKEKEILAAIGASLLTDIIILIGLPSIGHPLGFSDTLAGFISGIVPSNTAQCIAIGYAYSDEAGTVATIVKSARNAWMPVVILVMTYIYTRKGLPVGEKVHPLLLWNKFPKFILGLIIAATLGSVGLISPEGVALADDLSTWFFVTCFVGIGAGIDIKSLGLQELWVLAIGILMTLILALYAYFSTTFLLFF